jgi:dynein heavy chain
LFLELTDANEELPVIATRFYPIMHTIGLIWTYSTNYNTPARLLVLIRQICNAIIKQCRATIDGPKIFEAIKDEDSWSAHQKLTLCLEVCSKFKDAYFDYKARSKN